MGIFAYDCETCGLVAECNVDETGERICPFCQQGVLGITKLEARRRGLEDTDLRYTAP